MSSSLLGLPSSCGALRVPRCAHSPSRCGEGARACGFWSLQAWLQLTTCHGSVTKVSKRPSEGEANHMAPESPHQRCPPRQPRLEAFQVVFVMLGLVVLPAALTLQTVHHPGRLEITSANPTPLGYTISLALFVVPVSVLLWWLCRRRDLGLQRRACVRTLVVLVPLGLVLDIVFGNAFFTFPNSAATLGIGLPAVGGAIPLEEFLFYLSGFGVVLLTYVWADEYWMAAYNIPDYAAATAGIPRLVQFHWPSLAVGAGLLGTNDSRSALAGHLCLMSLESTLHLLTIRFLLEEKLRGAKMPGCRVASSLW